MLLPSPHVFVGVRWEVMLLTLVGGVFSNPCFDKVNLGAVTVINCLRFPREETQGWGMLITLKCGAGVKTGFLLNG